MLGFSIRVRARSILLVVALTLVGIAAGTTASASSLRVRVIEAQDIVLAAASAADGPAPFESVDGHRLTLLLEPTHEQILNPSFDGELHPVTRREVEMALADVRELPGQPLDLVVYCLPGIPLEVGATHCVGREIFLAPTFAPASSEVLAYTLTHEIGHAVEHLRVGDRSGSAWQIYLALRGLNAARFHATAPHRDRPAEIFAEDFRMLFGGPRATSSGSHENPALEDPQQVEGLASYFAGVLQGAYRGPRPPVVVSNRPNPFNPATTIEVRLRPERALVGGTAQVEIHDLRGRRVQLLPPQPVSELLSFRWDGTDFSGAAVASGRYLYRVRLREGTVAGSMLLLK